MSEPIEWMSNTRLAAYIGDYLADPMWDDCSEEEKKDLFTAMWNSTVTWGRAHRVSQHQREVLADLEEKERREEQRKRVTGEGVAVHESRIDDLELTL